MDPNIVGNNHHSQQRAHASEHEAVDGNDQGCTFQILQLWMFDLAIDLRERFLAAHREHRVTERHQHAKEPERRRERCPL